MELIKQNSMDDEQDDDLLDDFQLDQQKLILEKIINLKNNQGQFLSEKYDIDYIHDYFSKNINKLQKQFQMEQKKDIDLSDFLYIMLNYINHDQIDKIYLTISLIDFFQAITENDQFKSRIKFSDITSFLCDYIPLGEEPPQINIKIQSKNLPPQDTFKLNTKERIIRNIDQYPPIIIKENDLMLRRLIKESIKIDSIHHNNNLIISSCYAKDLNIFIILDSYCSYFLLYDSNCNLQKKIIPKGQSIKQLICTDCFWSERQQRLGGIFRENNLVFYEGSDKFSYEKIINVGEIPEIENQNKIWYIDFLNTWVTTSSCNEEEIEKMKIRKQTKNQFFQETNSNIFSIQNDEDGSKFISKNNILFFWDIEKEIPQFTLRDPVFKRGIIQIAEISYLKVLAIGSADNWISIWDAINQKMLFKFNSAHSHMHSVLFFNSYQCLLTAGFDNDISVYSLHPVFSDYNRLGELHGHSSLVTAIKAIEQTPLVISADDRFTIKLWDIRSLICIQNIELDLRSPIKFIHILNDRICLVNSRISVIELDRKLALAKDSEQSSYPLKVVYDDIRQELIVASKNELKIIYIKNGKTKKIYGGIKKTNDDEICTFETYQQFKKIIVGNIKGNIKIYASKDGEQIHSSHFHINQITQMKVDPLNNLLVSSSVEGRLSVSKIESNGLHQIREIKNILNGKELTIMALSVYHNIIITSTLGDRSILIWHYEFFKLLGTLKLDVEEEIKCVELINGFSLIFIGSSKGKIYIIKFKLNQQNIDLNLISFINLNDSLCTEDQENYQKIKQQLINKRKQEAFGTQHTLDDCSLIHYKSNKDMKSNRSFESVGVNMLAIQNVQQDSIISKKIIATKENSIQEQRDEEEDEIPIEDYLIQEQMLIVPNQLLIDFNTKKQNEKDFKMLNCSLIVSTMHGEIRIYNLLKIFELSTVKFCPHSNKKYNYNAFRVFKDDYLNILKLQKTSMYLLQNMKIVPDIIEENNQNKFLNRQQTQSANFNTEKLRSCSMLEKNSENDDIINMSLEIVVQKMCHKDQIHNISFINLNPIMLISLSHDNYIKIWDIPRLNLNCSLNITHPLPIQWNLKIDKSYAFKQKALHAIKSLLLMLKKYQSQITQANEKQFNLNEIFKEFQNQNISNEIKIRENSEKVERMQDMFSPRDLIFDKVKVMYERELKGPSLKHIAEIQRVKKQKFQSSLEDKQNEQEYKGLNIDQENQSKELKSFYNFIDVNFRKKMNPDVDELDEILRPKVKQLKNLLEKQTQEKLNSSSRAHRNLTEETRKTSKPEDDKFHTQNIKKDKFPEIKTQYSKQSHYSQQHKNKSLKEKTLKSHDQQSQDNIRLEVVHRFQTVHSSIQNLRQKTLKLIESNEISSNNIENPKFNEYALSKNYLKSFHQSDKSVSTNVKKIDKDFNLSSDVSLSLRKNACKQFNSILKNLNTKLKQSKGFNCSKSNLSLQYLNYSLSNNKNEETDVSLYEK